MPDAAALVQYLRGHSLFVEGTEGVACRAALHCANRTELEKHLQGKAKQSKELEALTPLRELGLARASRWGSLQPVGVQLLLTSPAVADGWLSDSLTHCVVCVAPCVTRAPLADHRRGTRLRTGGQVDVAPKH